MVNKIVNFLSRSAGGLHEAAFLLGISALASQVLGLVRDRLLAANFGAGVELDIYYSAFRLPDLLYVSLGSLLSITVMVPFIVNRLSRDDKAGARAFINSLFTIFCVGMIIISVVLFFLIPVISPKLFAGFNLEQQAELILLTRILLLSPFFLGLSNLFAAVTQSVDRFLVYALSPILYNLGIIAGILILYPILGLPGLAIGVVSGAVLHFAIQWPVVHGVGLQPKFIWPIKDWPEVKSVLLISVPRTITLAAHQLAILALVAQASLMAIGSIAIFNFAWNLQSVPLAIVGVSYSVAAFPVLSRLMAAGDKSLFLDQIALAARHIIFWSLPATVLFIVLRAQIVRVILGAGTFGWSETRLVAAALAIFSVSVVAQSLILLFVRAYYAAGKTTVPLIINSLSSIFVIALSFIIARVLITTPILRFFLESLVRVEDLPGTEVLALPLAFSTGLIINLIVIWLVFKHSFGTLGANLNRSFVQVFSASVFGGFTAYQFLAILGRALDLDTFTGIFLQGLIAGLVGIAAIIALLFVLGNREIRDLVLASKRFLPVSPVATEPEEL